jgi:hypothetical protein
VPNDDPERLFPAEKLKGHFSLNRSKIGMIGRDDGRADAPGSQRDQDIERQLP